MRLGVISDTHGVVHPMVAEVFAGVEHIIHAGDVCGEHVLEALREIAPVTAVAGNNDDATGLEIVRFRLGTLSVLLTHVLPSPTHPDRRVLRSLQSDPAAIVIFGHSHLPHDEEVGGIWYFNPGSAGPRRFDYPVCAGILEDVEGRWQGRHVPLDERSREALTVRTNQLSRP